MSGSEKSRKLQASLSYERIRLGDAAVERKGREGRKKLRSIVTFSRSVSD